MILAVDIGNTSIIVGCFDRDEIRFVETMSTDVGKTDLEYLVKFLALSDIYGIDKSDFDGAIVASVVPTLNRVFVSAIKKYCGVDAKLVGPGVKTGLNIHMDNPSSIGADLIVGSVAGLEKYGAPLVIIDMGTATTISVIDDKKSYVGGAIMPGASISLSSLVDRTAQLPDISLEKPSKVIGKNTVECMKSGIIMGQAGSIDGILDRIWDELGYETRVVATGGMARSIIPNCKKDIIIDDTLTLDGLKIIYDKNKKD